MLQHPSPSVQMASPSEGELFSLLLRLQATCAGEVALNSGPHVQAAFLDIVQQSSPALAEWLHMPNQRRPYTVSLLNGFHHRSSFPLTDESMTKSQSLAVQPGQVFWIRITLLDATVFHAFVQYLLFHSQSVHVRIGAVPFTISRVITTPDVEHPSSWAAYSSFQVLHTLQPARKYYTFEFTTPTVFSKGQKAWGKQLLLFPTPGMLFENLARQWECFAPASIRLAKEALTPKSLELWCDEQMVVSQYALATSRLQGSRFGQVGFQGQITYEVKGNPVEPVALWLTSLARFAFFSGVGYKTTMGMGQIRCLSLLHDDHHAKEKQSEEGSHEA